MSPLSFPPRTPSRRSPSFYFNDFPGTATPNRDKNKCTSCESVFVDFFNVTSDCGIEVGIWFLEIKVKEKKKNSILQ